MGHLHPMFNDSELPFVLRKPLVFGDMAQRQALHDLEIIIDRIEKRKALIEQGHLRLFTVEIDISGSALIDVYAKDENHAFDIVEDQLSIDDFDFGELSIESKRIVKRW